MVVVEDSVLNVRGIAERLSILGMSRPTKDMFVILTLSIKVAPCVHVAHLPQFSLVETWCHTDFEDDRKVNLVKLGFLSHCNGALWVVFVIDYRSQVTHQSGQTNQFYANPGIREHKLTVHNSLGN